MRSHLTDPTEAVSEQAFRYGNRLPCFRFGTFALAKEFLESLHHRRGCAVLEERNWRM